MQYDDREDPYTYPGTNTLRNRFGIKNSARLAKVEAAFTNQRMSEPLPDIALTSAGYKALHKHLFQDVYAWAGTLRTVEIAKDNSFFALTQFLARELDACFDAIRKDVRLKSGNIDAFIDGAAEHINELNARHPFREGNGRTQRALLEILADRAGHHLAMDKIEPARWNEASIAGFHKADHQPMKDLLRDAVTKGAR